MPILMNRQNELTLSLPTRQARSAQTRTAQARATAAMAENGLLNHRHILKLIETGALSAACPAPPIEETQIQPASLDLRLGRHGFRLRASFLPGPKAQVRQKAKTLSMHEFTLDDAMVLEKNCTYLIELEEELALPDNITASANPKSSSGRIDLFTRVIGDYGSTFNQLRPGYQGKLWLEISPRSFSVIVRPHARLSQLRFRRGRAAYDNYRLSHLHKAEALIVQSQIAQSHAQKSWQDDQRGLHLDQGLLLSIDLGAQTSDQLCGFRAKPYAPLIDVDKINTYHMQDFWQPLFAPKDGRMILEPDAFYILTSREAVRIPPTHAAEMMPFDSQIGEFRAHYAGFFDPGFGMGGDGAKAVLEIRSRETPFMLEHGQTIGRLIFERLIETAEKHYDARDNAHYQGQGLKLSKHFSFARTNHPPARKNARNADD